MSDDFYYIVAIPL